MSNEIQSNPAAESERVIRFIANEVSQVGVKTHLVGILGTDYKRLWRFCKLDEGERPIRDVTFMLELIKALGFSAAEVFNAAQISSTAEEMRSRLHDRSRSPPGAPALPSLPTAPCDQEALRPTG